LEIVSKSIEDNLIAAEKIINAYPSDRIFAFYGKMGAGKTTLIKAFCEYLGAKDIAKSPTFAIINEYELKSPQSTVHSPQKIFHFDFYRIEKEEEAFDIGFEEYLFSDNYCFIEWPEKIENLLPDEYIRIDIDEIENGHRRILSCNSLNI
jgi:tRNA threonylcarbamoyladenosine biosynthesis protein TsaE